MTSATLQSPSIQLIAILYATKGVAIRCGALGWNVTVFNSNIPAMSTIPGMLLLSIQVQWFQGSSLSIHSIFYIRIDHKVDGTSFQ